MIKVGLIPAAGKGIRAYPTTKRIPKVMLDISGKPVLQRNIELMRESLGIRDIIVIYGHLGEQIREFFGDGSAFGVKIRYIECPQIDEGVARGMCLARDIIKEPFVTILGDEVYVNSNHNELQALTDGKFDVICAIQQTSNPFLISRNYSVELTDGLITSLEEKPKRVKNEYLGCGTYVFTPEIFDHIDRTPQSARTGRVEITDVITRIAKRGGIVRPFNLAGEYVNINFLEDHNYANYVYKNAMFNTYKTSLIIPAYNEEESLPFVLSDFRNAVDEILVIDNCSEDRTAEIARERGARVITKKLGGYGDALKFGMEQAEGDIFILVEADASFRARDIPKLLEYLKDADMVIGSRTCKQLIEQGANMPSILRWGNVIVAKMLELFWWAQEPRFTDVGCTYRAIWKSVFEEIKDRLKSPGPEFSVDMMIEVLLAHKRVVELPVSYHPRVGGVSKISESPLKIVRTALRMLNVIFKKRFASWAGR